MSEYDIEVAGGKTVRLPTAGKYCDRDIVVTATGGDEDAAYSKGVADGKQAECDRFWDVIQNNGNPTVQRYNLPTWNDENFKPKYTVYATTNSFSDGLETTTEQCGMTDLRKQTIGVTVDWSLCTNFNYIFRLAPVKHVDTIDMSAAMSGWTLFRGSAIETVGLLILPKPEAKIAFKTHGFACASLKEIRFEGEFYGSVQFVVCQNLSLESAKSAILHLPNHTGTENAYTETISFNANTWALLDADDTAPGGVSWREYVQYVLCWNI